jgi:hypothetical protein
LHQSRHNRQESSGLFGRKCKIHALIATKSVARTTGFVVRGFSAPDRLNGFPLI